MLDPAFDPARVGAAILKEPLMGRGNVAKGVIVLNYVDDVIRLLPELRTFFFLVERRGWYGPNHSDVADIKLVEDDSTIEATKRLHPRAVALDVASADFVDTSAFRPLNRQPEFDVIQISCWSRRKRIELLIEAAAKLPDVAFLHLGYFENGYSEEEFEYRDACKRLATEAGANLVFAFGDRNSNDEMPMQKDLVNEWINKARVGVLTASREGRNRFKMECLAADRPVLVATDAGTPTQMHITDRTGLLFEPTASALADAIVHVLEHRDRFSPRGYLLSHTGRLVALPKLKNALKRLCTRSRQPYRFDDIDWDGRGERFTWGLSAFSLLEDALGRYRRARAASRAKARR